MSNSWQPYIVGHRGAGGIAPENTLPAFQTAANLCLPRVELDTRLSADGHVVVIHDATVDKTTDGTGRVDELTLEEIQRFDAAVHWAPSFPDTRIPTLDDVFTEFAGQFHWQVELKVDDRTDYNALVRAVVERIRWYEVGKVTLTSSSLSALRQAAVHAPDLGRALIIGSDAEEAVIQAEACGCTTVCVRRNLLDKHIVDLVRRCGMCVVGWTGNTPDELAELAGTEVDAVSTDRPDIALEWMREHGVHPRMHA